MLLLLAKKYPDIKNELRITLNEQMNKHTKDFDKRIAKCLMELNDDGIN